MSAFNHSVGIAHPTVVPKDAVATIGEEEGEKGAEDDEPAESTDE